MKVSTFQQLMTGFDNQKFHAMQNRNKSLSLFLFLACLLCFFFSSMKVPSFSHRSATSKSVSSSNLITEPHIGRTSTVLLGIFSMASEKAARRRDLIRDTYLQDGSGKICSLEQFKEQREQNDHDARDCQIAYTFVIGAGGDSRPTDHGDLEPLTLETDANGENEGDCTYLNIKENMETGKSPTYIKFAASLAAEYELDYVAKIDDDSLLGVDAFMSFINENLPPSPYNRRIYGGRMIMTTLYPFSGFYPMGQFYIMSSDLALYVGVELSASKRREMAFEIEDLDMAVYIYSHPYPIKLVDPSNRIFWIHPLKKEEEFLYQLKSLPRALPVSNVLESYTIESIANKKLVTHDRASFCPFL